jgi:capsular polysaccharide biosynthesis protein
VNELDLEARLETQGFTIGFTQGMSIEEQLRLFAGAQIVVAPTGAALAGCLFLPENAQVFELQPTNYTGIWVRSICDFLNIRWHGYFCKSPITTETVFIDGIRHENVNFEWKIEIDEFLEFLDMNTRR